MIPAVFIPGLLCTDALFDGQRAGLVGQLEISIGDISEADSIAAMARKILDQAPENFVLLGFSMGGVVALEIMRQASQRVRGLILADTGARADTPEQAGRRKEFVEFAESSGLEQAMRKSLSLLLHEERQNDEALIGKFLGMAEELGLEVFRRQQSALASREDYRLELRSIACPSLVLCGGDDAMTPPELSHELTAGIPGARLEIIADCGHLSVLERPDEVNAVVSRFVAEAVERESA